MFKICVKQENFKRSDIFRYFVPDLGLKDKEANL